MFFNSNYKTVTVEGPVSPFLGIGKSLDQKKLEAIDQMEAEGWELVDISAVDTTGSASPIAQGLFGARGKYVMSFRRK